MNPLDLTRFHLNAEETALLIIDVQTKHAIAAGATGDEVLEAMLIGSYMAMTRSQSYALRKYAENFGIELEPIDEK